MQLSDGLDVVDYLKSSHMLDDHGENELGYIRVMVNSDVRPSREKLCDDSKCSPDPEQPEGEVQIPKHAGYVNGV